jgi:hypothetical protein
MTIHELLHKFQNGHERFQRSPLFRTVVTALLNGNDPIGIIDQLITSQDEMSERMTEIVQIGTKHTIVIETKGEAQKYLELIENKTP